MSARAAVSFDAAGGEHTERCSPTHPPLINVTVVEEGLHVFVPTVPGIKEADIKARFKYQRLTEIEGRPEYPKLYNALRELCQNALAVKCSLGAGK